MAAAKKRRSRCQHAAALERTEGDRQLARTCSLQRCEEEALRVCMCVCVCVCDAQWKRGAEGSSSVSFDSS